MAELTTIQRVAIAALLSNKTIGDAARMADVGERTLYTWLADPDFRAELNAAEGVIIDAATRRLIALQDSAITALESILANKKQKPMIKLRAADIALSHMLKVRELRNIEQRLAALEAQQAKGGNP